MSAAVDTATRRRAERDLVTPEGVNLGVRLADVSTRFGALTLDVLIMVVTLIAGFLIIASAGVQVQAQNISVLLILFIFIVRNFYFMLFEMSPRAATPGKMMLGLRVANRTGARLATSAVFARNAMREIELFIPLTLLFGGSAIFGGEDAVSGWLWLLAVTWFLIFALFPLTNRDRLRVGDLIAGTWVVRSPKPVLLPDLSESTEARSGRYAFNPAQLGAYGVHELHVLEDVLRAGDPRTLREVAERIAEKIGWDTRPGETPEGFLRAYYAGLRGQLEAGLLMGRRRADKHDTAA